MNSLNCHTKLQQFNFILFLVLNWSFFRFLGPYHWSYPIKLVFIFWFLGSYQSGLISGFLEPIKLLRQLAFRLSIGLNWSDFLFIGLILSNWSLFYGFLGPIKLVFFLVSWVLSILSYFWFSLDLSNCCGSWLLDYF